VNYKGLNENVTLAIYQVGVSNCQLVNLCCAFGPDGVLRRHKDVYWFR
jgi:hypothetical protein